MLTYLGQVYRADIALWSVLTIICTLCDAAKARAGVSIGGVVGASEELPAVGDVGELQAALELVAELRRQLQVYIAL